MDFVTDRSQCVSVRVAVIHWFTSVWLAFLPSVRHVHRWMHRHILKFADDSVIVGLVGGNEQNHGPIMDDCGLVWWVFFATLPVFQKLKTWSWILESHHPAPWLQLFKGMMLTWWRIVYIISKYTDNNRNQQSQLLTIVSCRFIVKIMRWCVRTAATSEVSNLFRTKYIMSYYIKRDRNVGSKWGLFQFRLQKKKKSRVDIFLFLICSIYGTGGG